MECTTPAVSPCDRDDCPTKATNDSTIKTFANVLAEPQVMGDLFQRVLPALIKIYPLHPCQAAFVNLDGLRAGSDTDFLTDSA